MHRQGRHVVQQRRVEWHARQRRHPIGFGLGRSFWLRHPKSQLPHPRRRVQPPALLGRTLPHRLRKRHRPTHHRRHRDLAQGRRLSAHGRRGTSPGPCPTRRLARVPRRGHGNQHHARLGRQQLVLPALHGPPERPGVLRSREKRLLGPSGPLRGGRRTHHRAPVVLSVLDQIPARPRTHRIRRAFQVHDQPRHDLGPLQLCIPRARHQHLRDRHPTESPQHTAPARGHQLGGGRQIGP